MRRNARPKARVLNADQINSLKKQASTILAQTRRKMLDIYPFVGTIAMQLNIVPTRDCRISTAATDGTNIYFDIDFLNGLSAEDRMFIFAHEVYHNVMLHSLRLETRDHELFNIATDCEINYMLSLDGLQVPADACMPVKYGLPNGRSAEEYYDMLISKNESTQRMYKQMADAGHKGDKIDIKPIGQFDKHIYQIDEQPLSGNEDTEDSFGRVGYDEDYKPNVEDAAVENIREAAVAAITELEQIRGIVPAHLKKIVTKLLEPSIDWKEVLNKFVTRTIGDHRTWSRPNRRFAHQRVYLPSSFGEKIRLAIGIDTSASVNAYLPRFLGELNGIVSNFNYEIHVIQCDSQIQDYQKYDNDCPLKLENGLEIKGHGGTKLTPIFDYITLNSLDIDACVMLTDGYCEEFKPENAPDFPVLWCVTDTGSTDNLKFGEISRLAA